MSDGTPAPQGEMPGVQVPSRCTKQTTGRRGAGACGCRLTTGTKKAERVRAGSVFAGSAFAASALAGS